MPRKPFKEQAGYQFSNRSRSHMINYTVKCVQRATGATRPRYAILRHMRIVIRNPRKSPLLSNGGAK